MNMLEAGGRICAVMPVHYGGRPCDMERIKKIADEYGLKVVEDAAHAVGATYNGSSQLIAHSSQSGIQNSESKTVKWGVASAVI